jgi:hypothetical protein
MPKEFVQQQLEHLTELGERGEEDPEAPGYFSARPEN